MHFVSSSKNRNTNTSSIPCATTCTHAYVPIDSSSFSLRDLHFARKFSASSIVQQYAVTLQSSTPESTPSRPSFLSRAACSLSLSRFPPRWIEHDDAASTSAFD